MSDLFFDAEEPGTHKYYTLMRRGEGRRPMQPSSVGTEAEGKGGESPLVSAWVVDTVLCMA